MEKDFEDRISILPYKKKRKRDNPTPKGMEQDSIQNPNQGGGTQSVKQKNSELIATNLAIGCVVMTQLAALLVRLLVRLSISKCDGNKSLLRLHKIQSCRE